MQFIEQSHDHVPVGRLDGVMRVLGVSDVGAEKDRRHEA